jgi:hypothetical protein
MNVQPNPESRPRAMADVPGACELPLTRAVVQYRDVHELDTPGGRIQDIGLALVVEGRYASSAEVVDLGSGALKMLDLSHELVVLDWVYEPTLDHVAQLIRAAAQGDGVEGELGRFCFQIALQVFERVGFSPLTRPSLLRLGFRDVCRDLDMHEGTSVRIRLDRGRIVRAHLDYEGAALVFSTPTARRDGTLEGALTRCFPGHEVRRTIPASTAAAGGYQIRFALPHSLGELRDQVNALRSGLIRMLTLFEPERLEGLEAVLETFGQRETLARLRTGHGELRTERLVTAAPADVVH